MLNIQPITLKGTWVQLEPLNVSHKKELYTAAQDESIWTYTSSKAFGERFNAWFDNAVNALQSLEHLPFIVRRLADHKIIGSTRYYDINAQHHRIMVGYTWYVPEVWGTYVNPECKLLMLKFAFDDLLVNRVEFATDSRNTRSRSAIKKLGAIEEGILRYHTILEDGYIRDTVMFSVVKPDWPQIKSNLQLRLKKMSDENKR
ncbi:MAG: GNAT family N-acetyltransferase [Gammaproteobacteria bacterium]|nr:GNAT family N-acetyltransferase [Gammaproteobacteria bacterium]